MDPDALYCSIELALIKVGEQRAMKCRDDSRVARDIASITAALYLHTTMPSCASIGDRPSDPVKVTTVPI